MKRVVVAALALCAGLSGTADLGATTCSSPSTVVLPGALGTSPLNTHVWIYGFDDPTDPARFELRSAPRGKSAGEVIPASQHRMQTGDNTFTIELIPGHDLSPKTRFEVWSIAKTERLIGTLRTGTATDRIAPSWSGATKVEPIFSRGGKRKPGVIVVSDEYGLRVLGARASDAQSRVLYAAWNGVAGKPIDFSRPPDGYAYDTDPTSNVIVILGQPGVCAPTTFAVPDNEKEIQIGLAAVDLAGNRSATSEHRVKL